MIFRKDRLRRPDDRVDLYVREQLECMKLCLRVNYEGVKSLRVKIKGHANLGDTVVGFCYRPSGRGRHQDLLQTLVLIGDFNHPDICWKDNTDRHKQLKNFLQNTGKNFLTKMGEDPTRRGVLLDLVLTEKEGLFGDVQVGSIIGCSDQEMVEWQSCVEEAWQ